MNNDITVEEYISSAPKELQSKLRKMRKIIIDSAPKAKESISYGMPHYQNEGKIAYFAYAKKHIGLYIPPPIIANHSKDLRKYGTSKSAVRIPIDQDLPVNLIKKLVKARIRYNKNN
jgi:uncharacterized protein YdhG (YjbR/CyaY superfamily)